MKIPRSWSRCGLLEATGRNTKYPDTVCDFLPDPLGVRVTGMTLSYQREAAFGDLLTVERATDGQGNFYIRTKKDGATCLEAYVSTEPR